MEALTMPTVIQQTEAQPAEHNRLPSCAHAALAWQRVEPYIAWRFAPRAVVWIVEGPGEWSPPLKPATVSAVEIWTGEAWENVTENASPLGGYCLSGAGPYRFTASVGSVVDQAPPTIVQEAVKRLAEYLGAEAGTAGAASETSDIPGVLRRELTRSPSWMARAMQNSGAADLLRTYRRA
jgi:hypothetical protein